MSSVCTRKTPLKIRNPMQVSRVPTKSPLRLQYSLLAHEYCSSSSLHGLSWIARTRWSSGARIFWTAIVALGIALCIYMSYVLWLRYEENPTMYVVETINYPTSKIRFPSVEICNALKVYEPKTKNISKILRKNGYKEQQIKYWFGTNIGIARRAGLLTEHARMIKIMNNNGYTLKKIFDEVYQPCTAMLMRCKWRSLEIDCSSMFYTSISYNGHCCRFSPKYLWNNTKGLDLNYIAGFGERQGLSLHLNISNNKDFDTNAIRNHAEVHVFNREKSMKSNNIYEGQKLNLAISPSLHTATERVRMMAPDQRRCGYVDGAASMNNDDLRLHHSYAGCAYYNYILDLLEHCGCVTLHAAELDPSAGWEKYPMCTLADTECYKKYAVFTNVFTEMAEKGACLAACDRIDYDATPDYTDHDIDLKTNVSILNIYFQDRRCKKYTREEAMSPFQLFAAFGGVFGLCLGGTLISVIEFIWFIIKFIFVIFKYKQPKKSLCTGSQQLEPSLGNEKSDNSGHNKLFLDELFPYGYKDNKLFVLPQVID